MYESRKESNTLGFAKKRREKKQIVHGPELVVSSIPVLLVRFSSLLIIPPNFPRLLQHLYSPRHYPSMLTPHQVSFILNLSTPMSTNSLPPRHSIPLPISPREHDHSKVGMA